MRRFLPLIVVMLLLLPSPIFAQIDCDDLDDIVKSYLKAKHSKPPRPIRVAVYDTKDRSWHAYRWHENRLEPTGSAIEVAFNNDPTLFVRRGEDVAVLIARMDPLHYTTEVTSMTRADIEGLEALQQLASKFGGSIQTIATRTTLLQQDNVVTSADLESFNANRAFQHESTLSMATARLEIVSARDELQPLVDAFLDVLAKHHNGLQGVITAQQAPIETAGTSVLGIDDLRAGIVEKLQRAELGAHSPLDPQTATTLPRLRATILGELDAAAAAARALTASKPVCTSSLAALDDVLRLVIDGTPVDPDEADDVRQLYRAAFRRLRPSALNEDCPATDATSALHAAISALVTWLRDPNHRAAAVADEEVDELLVQARKGSSEYGEAVAQRADLLATAKEVQEKRAETLKLATQLQHFGDLYNAQAVAQSDCWMHAGVVEVDRVQNAQGFDLPWYQVQTEEFAMTVRPTFSDDVVRKGPDVKGKYTFSRNIDFGVDTALIYTRAHDREYKGIEKAIEDRNDDGKITDADKAFYPTQISRTDRTGKLALMMTLSPSWGKGFGAQIGFGADTDNPAAYIGLTRSFGRFVRVSAGHTQQRVTRLGKGQSFDESIASAEDLRTRKAFDASWYAALAFTISELPIFQAD